jgi:hypothetical protein
VFAKREITLKPEGSDARAIHTQDRIAQNLFGAVTNALNYRLADVLQENNPNTGVQQFVIYPCGATDKEIAEMRARQTGQPVEGDYSNNDATHPREARLYYARVLARLGAPEWWLKLYVGITDVHVYSRQLGIKADVRGQNHSGETTVTINNVLQTTATALGTFIRTGVNKFSLLVYGDDSLATVPEKAEDVARDLEESAASNGMKLTVATPERHQATFLQTRIYEQGHEVIPVPKLGRVLTKLNLRSNNNKAVNDKDYYAGKYLSAAYKMRFFPKICDTLVSISDILSPTPYMEQGHRPVNDTGKMLSNIRDVRQARSDDLARDAVQKIYGLSYEDVNEAFALAGIGLLQCLSGDGNIAGLLKELNLHGVDRQVTGLESDAVLVMTRLDNT